MDLLAIPGGDAAPALPEYSTLSEAHNARVDRINRGLSGGTVELALEEADEDWFALARAVRVRKFGDALPGDFAEKARQMRFLQYRGFESSQVQAAVSAHGDD